MIKSVNKLEKNVSKKLASDTGIFLLRAFSIILLFFIKYANLETLNFFNDNLVKLILLLLIVYVYFIDLVTAVVFIIIFIVLLKEIKIKNVSKKILNNYNQKNCVLGNKRFVKSNNEELRHQEEVKNNMVKIVSRDNLNAGFKTPFGEIRVPNKYETFNNVSTQNNNSSVTDNTHKFNFHLYSHPSSRTLTENHQNLSMGYTTSKHLKDIQINSVAGASECDSIESIKASYNAQGLKEPRGVDNFENKNSYLR